MVMARWTATVQDAEGNAVPGCEIEVRNANTGLLTQVYSDRDGTVPLGNPFVSADATFGFHVVGGAYRITARKGAFTALWNYVGIGTMGEFDFESIAFELEAGLYPVATLADLNAYVPGEGQSIAGIVLNDPDPSNNGYYLWSGTAWEWQRGLPDTIARLTVIGGTENALEVQASEGVDPGSVLAFFIDPLTPNTGPVTIKINGDDPVPAYDYTGEDFVPGAFSGRVFLSREQDGSLRSLMPADLAARAAQSVLHAEEWAQSPDPISVDAGGDGVTDRSARYWADQAGQITIPNGSVTEPKLATGGVSTRALADGSVTERKLSRELSVRLGAAFADVREMLASIIPPQGEGAVWRAGPFEYREASPGDTDHQLTTAAGVPLYVMPDEQGRANVLAFGAVADGITDDLAAFQAAYDTGRSIFVPQVDNAYYLSAPITVVTMIRIGGGFECYTAPSDMISTRIYAPNGFLFNPLTGAGGRVNIVMENLEIYGDDNVTATALSGPFGGRLSGNYIHDFQKLVWNEEAFLLTLSRNAFGICTIALELGDCNETVIDNNWFGSSCGQWLKLNSFTRKDHFPLVITRNNFNAGGNTSASFLTAGNLIMRENYLECFSPLATTYVFILMLQRFSYSTVNISDNHFNAGSGSQPRLFQIYSDNASGSVVQGHIDYNWMRGFTETVTYSVPSGQSGSATVTGLTVENNQTS